MFSMVLFMPFVAFGYVNGDLSVSIPIVIGGNITVTYTNINSGSEPFIIFNNDGNPTMSGNSTATYNLDNDLGIQTTGTIHIAIVDDNTTNGNCQVSYSECLSDTGLLAMFSYNVVNPNTGSLFGGGSTTELLSNIGSISTDTVNTAYPYLILFIGIPLTFYIIQQLKKTIPSEVKTDKKEQKINDMKGYSRIISKEGVVQGWKKD